MKISSSEIRKKFIDYFKSKGHIYIDSSPIIPPNDDKTLLFTNAGMVKFKDICDDYMVHPMAIGTSALRDAKNKNIFINDVHKKTGIKIEVISGDKEAEYIFKGVKKTFIKDSGVIMDIGGGSTEIIYFKNNQIIKKKSFDIGVSRIYQMFDFQDPISKRES